MNAFPDTSFLCALYRPQGNSAAARSYYQGLSELLHVSRLLLFEFRQSMRFQVWRHLRDSSVGIAREQGATALADLNPNLGSGALVVVDADWGKVLQLAEDMSARRTITGGHRTLDVLHVATGKQLGARELLSFDANQRRLAAVEGLEVNPL
ncbi:MAG: type II toxin-antitoxin system VapC family toxin [Verrucomicrobiae bacterium]|nr:type II toxin-antitoxin system VapC family toxin [Verrucomicrobiae bacterium]MCP5520063.1 type II toxin-antitoxin system VapC family toxin [Verrucomicrobiales bacterium]